MINRFLHNGRNKGWGVGVFSTMVEIRGVIDFSISVEVRELLEIKLSFIVIDI